MSSKIKIALCLSGEPRSSMLCFPYIYESFINLGEEFEVDVFIHSWKSFRALSLYNPKKFYLDSTSEDRLYQSFLHQISTFKDDVKVSGNQVHLLPVKNTILMHYGLKQVFDLTQETKYDYYIRCRLDILFQSRVNLNYIINKLKFNNKDIWLPQDYNDPNWQNEYNDQLAIGNYKSMNTYFNCIKHIPDLVHQTKSYLPETLLGAHLNNSNLSIEWGDVTYSLIRKSYVQTHPYTFQYFDE